MHDHDKTRLIVGGVISTGLVIHSLIDSFKTHRREQAKREKIHSDMELDIIAIRRATDYIHEELTEGKYDGFGTNQLIAALNDRIAFEKITIRLEH